jgi:hypothetical protein
MAHGTYCKSGTAYRDPSSPSTAICVSINNVDETTEKNPKTNAGSLDLATLKCKPDGDHYCHYAKRKDGPGQAAEVKFSLPCECGLYEVDGVEAGHCPIPGIE